MKFTKKQEKMIMEYWENATETIKNSIIYEISSYDGNFENDYWEEMDDFDELLESLKPWEIARAIYFGNFCPTHEWWRWDVYGNLESTDYLKIDIEAKEVIDALSEIPKDYAPYGLEEFLKD